jgi:hypothetical protein
MVAAGYSSPIPSLLLLGTISIRIPDVSEFASWKSFIKTSEPKDWISNGLSVFFSRFCRSQGILTLPPTMPQNPIAIRFDHFRRKSSGREDI